MGGMRPGKSFKEAIANVESVAVDATESSIDRLGAKAPTCWRSVWALLEALYSYSTCSQQCPGGDKDHTFRYLGGRATNLALGAVSNARAGHYDASLLVIRGLGELGNVTAALVSSPQALEKFKGGRSLRGTEFAVLKSLGIDPLVSGRRYGLLSERAVHPSLDELITTHTPGANIIGPAFQEAGFLLCLNECAIALAAFIHLTRDPTIQEGERAAILDAVETLANSIGGVLIDNLPSKLRMVIPRDRWRVKGNGK